MCGVFCVIILFDLHSSVFLLSSSTSTVQEEKGEKDESLLLTDQEISSFNLFWLFVYGKKKKRVRCNLPGGDKDKIISDKLKSKSKDTLWYLLLRI